MRWRRAPAVTDAFTYTMADANGATSSTALTITITGTNDAPVAVADSNAGDAVVETGVNPGNTPFAGDPSAAGNVLTNDTDVDTGDTQDRDRGRRLGANVGQPVVGTYGSLTLAADGTWSYTLEQRRPRHQRAGAGRRPPPTSSPTRSPTPTAPPRPRRSPSPSPAPTTRRWRWPTAMPATR